MQKSNLSTRSKEFTNTSDRVRRKPSKGKFGSRERLNHSQKEKTDQPGRSSRCTISLHVKVTIIEDSPVVV